MVARVAGPTRDEREARGEAPLGFAESHEDLTIEHDEETIAKRETVDEFT